MEFLVRMLKAIMRSSPSGVKSGSVVECEVFLRLVSPGQSHDRVIAPDGLRKN
jgi:hypothetical protein